MKNTSLKITRKKESLSLSDEKAPVPYSISAGYDDGSACSTGLLGGAWPAEALSTRAAFAAYALPATATGGYEMPSVYVQPVRIQMAAAVSASPAKAAKSAAAAGVPAAAASSSAVYTWVLGVKVENNVVTGRFWDANKVNPYTGGEDCYMCWAGAAASMIGWWQYYYGAAYCTDRTVALSAQGILEVFKDNWENEGGFTDAGCQWWLAGGSDESDNYAQLEEDSRLTGAGTTSAGYYSRFYSTEKVHRIAYEVEAKGRGGVELASEMAAKIDGGCILGLGIWDPSDDGRHALALWGIKRSSGYITELQFTDSNDGADGSKRMLRATVSYDSSQQAYRILRTYDCYGKQYITDYDNWYLEDYSVLSPFEYGSVIKPSNLKVSQSGSIAVFRWNGEQRKGLTYQLAYKLVGASKYTYVSCSSRSLSLSLPSEGTYTWAVRALDKDGDPLYSWKWGAQFCYDVTPPQLTLHGPYLRKKSGGGTSAEFVWSANEAATYKLAINGKVVYNGKASSRTVTLTGRSNRYTIKATDAYGNASVYRGNIYSVGGKPTTPRPGSARVLGQGKQVTFSWSRARSSRAVTYEIRLKGQGSKRYVYRRGFTSTSATVNFSSMKKWSWAVRAVDSYGYYSSWRAGRTFNNDRVAPTVKLSSLSTKKKTSNRSLVSFRWSADETCTYSLTINGKRYYYGKGRKRSMTLKDGLYNYTLTAKDAAGNRTRRKGTFRCDTVAPARPSGLVLEKYENGCCVTFNWKSVRDVSGVTYQLAIKTTGSSGYTYYKTTATTLSLRLNVCADWKWAVRSLDGNGNRSSWRFGSSFSNWEAAASSSARKATASAVKQSSVSLDRELAVSSGTTAQTVAAGASLSGESASALLDNQGQSEDKYRTLLAAC